LNVSKLPKFGIMIELPALIEQLDEVAPLVDFFSLGTNDLSHAFFNGGGRGTTAQGDSLDPSFLKMLESAASSAKRNKKWIGICGEMASDPDAQPLLLGMGLDELSMASPRILPAKRQVASLNSELCRNLLQQAMHCSTAIEVRQLVRNSVQANQELITPAAIDLKSAAKLREEAITELVDLLRVTGRVKSPEDLEDAIWAREETYATDMGFGFAIPHCKTEAVTSSSLAVIRLSQPIFWSEKSESPVSLILLLAMRPDAASHLQVFAKLARRLMNEEFRNTLMSLSHEEQFVQFLSSQIEAQ
jgi:fructose-specific phosphotransferase system IIA component